MRRANQLYVQCYQGYLAVTLLMHENSDFLRLVVNSIRKDLDENNEISNCLALHAIANVGGTDMAEALCEDVHRLLISPYVGVAAVQGSCPLTIAQDFAKHGKEEGCSNVAPIVPQTSRCNPRGRVGTSHCCYHG
jgi:AP-2 complex subunit alpha